MKTNEVLRFLPQVSLSLLAFGVMAISADAAALTTTLGGVLNGGGLSVAVSPSCINFYNTATPDACPNSGSPDTYTVGAPSDSSLFTLGSTGSILDLPSGTTTLTNWMVVDGVDFNLTGIVVPNAVACPPGTTPGSCSAGDFVFTQDDFSNGSTGDVTISFSVSAVGYTGSVSTGSTPYKFTFSSHFTNTTVAAVLSQYINTPPVVDSVSFSAAPVTGAPEPAAFVLLGSGLLGLGIFGKRVRNR